MSRNDRVDLSYIELRKAVKEIEPWYDVDKVKFYSVYIWTKDWDYDDDEDNWGENVFDIMEDKIVYYNKDHVIPEEAMLIIQKIQSKLRDVRLALEDAKG